MYTLDSELYLPQSFSASDTIAFGAVIVILALLLVVKIIAKYLQLNGFDINVRTRQAVSQVEDTTGPSRHEILRLNQP